MKLWAGLDVWWLFFPELSLLCGPRAGATAPQCFSIRWQRGHRPQWKSLSAVLPTPRQALLGGSNTQGTLTPKGFLPLKSC